MWDTIGKIFTSDSFLSNIPGVLLLIIGICILAKMLKVKVKTGHLTIGAEDSNAFYERSIVRNQIQAAHEYVRALEQICDSMIEPEDRNYGGYRTKYILELIFDKVVEWITYNHLEYTEAYVSCKEREIDNLLRKSLELDVFKTNDFMEMTHKWTKEIISQLIDIRKMYQKQMDKIKEG